MEHKATYITTTNFNQNNAQLEKQATQGQIQQHKNIIDLETGENRQLSLAEYAEFNKEEYHQLLQSKKNLFGHNITPIEEKITAHEKAINKEKSANLRRYKEKGRE